MLRSYVYATCTFLLLACSNTTEILVAAASFSEEELEICIDVSCPEINISYITVTGDEEISAVINDNVKNFIIESLYLGDETMLPSAKNIAEAAKQFVEMYRTHSAEFPDMQMEYFAEIKVKETYKSENLLSLRMNQYLFTGGAHGYGATSFTNFDLHTGMPIPIEDLFKDYEAFEEFVEARFRKANDILENDSINSTGFWFEEDEFYLPEALGFTESSLIIIFNQYEIASYAAGPINLEIPIEEVSPFLAIQL